LISNSLKFTTTGSITLRTRLLSPLSIAWATDGTQSPLSTAGVLPPIGEQTQSYSTSQTLDVEKGPRDEDGSPLPALVPSKRRGRMAIVRIEVEDTGVGLRPADMEEYVISSHNIDTKADPQNSSLLAICPDRDWSAPRRQRYRSRPSLRAPNRPAQQRSIGSHLRIRKRKYLLARTPISAQKGKSVDLDIGTERSW
jgi:hypothetical protein